MTRRLPLAAAAALGLTPLVLLTRLAGAPEPPPGAQGTGAKRTLLQQFVHRPAGPARAAIGPAGAAIRRPQSEAAPVPKLRRVVLVVFENHSYDEIVGSRSAPSFAGLAARGALLTRYAAVTHPSLPNYLALVSGSTQGITDDCTSCSVDAPTIADTLRGVGKSWKAYAEGIPRPGFTGPQAGRYAKKHVPFLYFRSIASNRARRAHIVGFDALGADLAADRLPAFALVVPDLCHDMHDCSVATGDRWLGAILPRIRKALGPGGVLFVVFDEDDYSGAAGGGRVAAYALGAKVKAGVRDPERTGHYGLLRTIEDALGLPRLGASANAPPIGGIWQG